MTVIAYEGESHGHVGEWANAVIKQRALCGTAFRSFATVRTSKTSLRRTSQPGDHQRIVVKVIDLRGNEVVRVMGVEGQARAA